MVYASKIIVECPCSKRNLQLEETRLRCGHSSSWSGKRHGKWDSDVCL